jgi:DNA-binding protein YbaB
VFDRSSLGSNGFHSQDMFGDSAVPRHIHDDKLNITVNGKVVEIDLKTLDASCADDETLRDMVYTAVNKLNQVLV